MAKNVCLGPSPVAPAPESGNGDARKKPATNERAVRSKSLVSKLISGDAKIAGNREKLAIGTARSVPRSEKNSRTGNGAGGPTTKRQSLRFPIGSQELGGSIGGSLNGECGLDIFAPNSLAFLT